MTEQEKAEIYLEYSEKVGRYLQNRLRNPQLAEDLCADVFVKIYEKIDTFDREKASLSTWIYTLTRNTLTDYFRSHREMDEVPDTFADDSQPEEEVCNEMMLERLAEAMEKLTGKERDIIIFYYYTGLTLRDAAEKMDISYSYAKLLHNRALEQLKDLL